MVKLATRNIGKTMYKSLIIFISLFTGLIFSQGFQVLSGDIIQIDDDIFRTCPDLVDSCIYVCSEGEPNPCHPENLFVIVVDSSTGDTVTEGSRFRIYFPWEYEEAVSYTHLTLPTNREV